MQPVEGNFLDNPTKSEKITPSPCPTGRRGVRSKLGLALQSDIAFFRHSRVRESRYKSAWVPTSSGMGMIRTTYFEITWHRVTPYGAHFIIAPR
jgi:hypothetical protein